VDLIWEAVETAARLIISGDPQLAQIAGLSLAVSGAATLLAAVVGVPLGATLHVGRFRGQRTLELIVSAGMGLPPVLVGLGLTILLWRSGPFGALGLLFTPSAMVVAQFLVALPFVAGFTAAALSLLERELTEALRVDGADDARVGAELVRAAWPQVVVAVAAGFGRALSEVGASLMVGGNIVGQTRIFTTAIALETSKGEFALAMALGFILLALALLVNAVLGATRRVAVAA
jgi:ABC-type tungstate transport system substrate-binding protein